MFLYMHRSRWPPDVSIITINNELHNDEAFCASCLSYLDKTKLRLSAASCPQYTDINIQSLYLSETIKYLVMCLDWNFFFNNCYGTLVIVNQYGCDSSYITLVVHLKC